MDLLEQLLQHTSVRSFTPEKLNDETKQQLIQAAQSPSSSNFLQAFSLIEVQDKTKLKSLEEISGAVGHTDTGVYYLVVADLNKHARILQQAQQDLRPLKSMESLVVSIVDATIATQAMVTYAESIGLGICYIGGIRNDLFKVKELFNLPAYTYPLYGLTIGIPTHKNQVKPRPEPAMIVSQDTYSSLDTKLLADYDQKMAKYYGSRSSNQVQANWSQKILAHFSQERRKNTQSFLLAQGFNI